MTFFNTFVHLANITDGIMTLPR